MCCACIFHLFPWLLVCMIHGYHLLCLHLEIPKNITVDTFDIFHIDVWFLNMSFISTYGAGLTGLWSLGEVIGPIKRWENAQSPLFGGTIVVFWVFGMHYVSAFLGVNILIPTVGILSWKDNSIIYLFYCCLNLYLGHNLLNFLQASYNCSTIFVTLHHICAKTFVLYFVIRKLFFHEIVHQLACFLGIPDSEVRINIHHILICVQ